MAGVKVFIALIVVAISSGTIGGARRVDAQVDHHVIGGDNGWGSTSDIVSWSSSGGRDFRVGDNIWFTYSAAAAAAAGGEGSMVELESMEEYLLCDVSNPIRIYSEGLDYIVTTLEGEGIRYFASGDPESCKNGLKLHVEVIKQQPPTPEEYEPAMAPIPFASTHLTRFSYTLFVSLLLLCYVVL